LDLPVSLLQYCKIPNSSIEIELMQLLRLFHHHVICYFSGSKHALKERAALALFFQLGHSKSFVETNPSQVCKALVLVVETIPVEVDPARPYLGFTGSAHDVHPRLLPHLQYMLAGSLL
jgi:hypothetical protein